MADSSLAAIRILVRDLTLNISDNQLSDDDIDFNVNTFIENDFPAYLKLFSQRSVFKFFCNPFQDVYVTDKTLPTTDPLYNFKNRYTSVHPPVYVGGQACTYTQSPGEFFALYPNINYIFQLGNGDGSNASFSGNLPNVPVIANQVMFESIDANNNGIVLRDIPNAYPNNNTGILVVPNTTSSMGTINYITGAYSFNFPVAPKNNAPVNSQTVAYSPSIPLIMMYYDDMFVLRPIPDKPYAITFQVYKRPAELLLSGSVPDLDEQWQYIAYGAAIKILQRRRDNESVNEIMPEFLRQQSLMLNRTVMQYANQRTPTIYYQNYGPNNSFNNPYGNGWNIF